MRLQAKIQQTLLEVKMIRELQNRDPFSTLSHLDQQIKDLFDHPSITNEEYVALNNILLTHEDMIRLKQTYDQYQASIARRGASSSKAVSD